MLRVWCVEKRENTTKQEKGRDVCKIGNLVARVVVGGECARQWSGGACAVAPPRQPRIECLQTPVSCARLSTTQASPRALTNAAVETHLCPRSRSRPRAIGGGRAAVSQRHQHL